MAPRAIVAAELPPASLLANSHRRLRRSQCVAPPHTRTENRQNRSRRHGHTWSGKSRIDYCKAVEYDDGRIPNALSDQARAVLGSKNHNALIRMHASPRLSDSRVLSEIIAAVSASASSFLEKCLICGDVSTVSFAISHAAASTCVHAAY